MRVFLLVTLILATESLLAQNFTAVTPNEFAFLPYGGNAKWADLNNDGKLELVYTGPGSASQRFTNIMYLDAGVFKTVTLPEGGGTQISFDNLDFGDYDGDGDLDITVNGNGIVDNYFVVLRNDGGLNFTKMFSFPPPFTGTVYWRDANNDGTLDLVHQSNAAGIYLNQQGKFDNLVPLYSSAYPYVSYQNCADVDSDGDLDILQGRWPSSYPVAYLGNFLMTRNNDGTYTEVVIPQMPSPIGGAEFTDIDSDGDLDVLIKTNDRKSVLYKFENGNFVNTNISLPNANHAKWADFNNDGAADILFGGIEVSFMNFVTRIYYNNGSGTGFTDSGITDLPSYNRGTTAVGDYDGDGDPDVAVMGDGFGGVYKNNWIENSHAANAAPGAPSPVSTLVNFNSVRMEWTEGTDDKTPVASLTYNLEVLRSDGSRLMPASLTTSTRTLYQPGNTYLGNHYTVGCLQEGSYQWRVQSIDNSFAGSSFTSNQNFSVVNVRPTAPTSALAVGFSDKGIKVTWADQGSNETSYALFRKPKVDTYNLGYYKIIDLPANTTSFADTTGSMAPLTTYVYKIVASNCSYPDQYFQETEGTTLPPLFESSNMLPVTTGANGGRAVPGDYDNDGDLDLLIYFYDGSAVKCGIYKNTNGQYADTGVRFPVLENQGSLQWIDFNRDGYLDVIVVLYVIPGYKTELYLNNKSGLFVKTEHNLPAVASIGDGGLMFSDYDNDGDLDLLISTVKTGSGQYVLQLYKNDGANLFTDSGITIDSKLFLTSSRPWGDFDNDGYPDLLVTSRGTDCGSYRVRILKNVDGTRFTEVDPGISEGLRSGESEWCDYDNDGYLDFIVAGESGCTAGGAITKVYHNNKNGTFSEIASSFAKGMYENHPRWADFNNDGFSDMFLYLDPFAYSASPRTRLYWYNNGGFRNAQIPYFPERTQGGNAAVGDFDNDNDVDLLVMGQETYTTTVVKLFKSNYANIWGLPNHKPQAPTNLSETITANKVSLRWGKATDTETLSNGLSYNIYLTRGADTLIMSNSRWNGYRKIVAQGNVFQNTAITLNNMPQGTYTWGVQAIDKAYAGGSFGEKRTFTITTPLPVTPTVTGLESLHESFKFFPNPIENGVLYLDAGFPTEIRISDITGHEVLVKTIEGAESIHVGHWASGIYILRYASKDGAFAAKLIKR